jgi:hypothetical protein
MIITKDIYINGDFYAFFGISINKQLWKDFGFFFFLSRTLAYSFMQKIHSLVGLEPREMHMWTKRPCSKQ